MWYSSSGESSGANNQYWCSIDLNLLSRFREETRLCPKHHPCARNFTGLQQIEWVVCTRTPQETKRPTLRQVSHRIHSALRRHPLSTETDVLRKLISQIRRIDWTWASTIDSSAQRAWASPTIIRSIYKTIRVSGYHSILAVDLEKAHSRSRSVAGSNLVWPARNVLQVKVTKYWQRLHAFLYTEYNWIPSWFWCCHSL